MECLQLDLTAGRDTESDTVTSQRGVCQGGPVSLYQDMLMTCTEGLANESDES